MSVLEFKNLSIGYRQPILKPIFLSVKSPQIIGIIGRNGSGKSTLTKTLLKLIEPKGGQITLNSKNIEDYSIKEWANYFSAVFSRVSHIPHILTNELMDLGCTKNTAYKTEIIERLQLKDITRKYADELSDGQLQKVLIGRAIYQNTPYMVWDEPTAHLDYIAKKEVFRLAKEIHYEMNKTIFFISHEVEALKQIADVLWWIKDGALHLLSPDDFKVLDF